MFRHFISRVIDRLLAARINTAVEHALLHHHRVFGPKEELIIASSAKVQNAMFNTVSGRITIEELVFFGHSVSVMTGAHNPDATGHERMHSYGLRRDIIIKRGAWIASNATILGPCVIGEDAVVAACSLVRCNVAAKTIVAGVPAKFLRAIAENNEHCEPC